MDLRVVSMNCFDSLFSLLRRDRLQRIATELSEKKPDIICLQEITFTKTAHLFDDQFLSNGYSSYYSPGMAFNRGGLYVASVCPIQEYSFVRFHKQSACLSMQLTDHLLTKGYQKIVVSISRHRIVLYNTHLVNVYRIHSVSEREVQKAQLRQLSADVEGEQGSALVCGDLNIEPKSNLYQEFLHKTHCIDSLKNSDEITVSKQNTHVQRIYIHPADKRIDYILSTPDISCREQKVLFNDLYPVKQSMIHLSDHFGLQSIFSV